MDFRLRDSFTGLCETMAACSEAAGFEHSKEDIENTLKYEILSFMGYITSSDEITGQDMENLAFYTGIDCTVYELLDFCEEMGVQQGIYEYNVPGLLDICVKLDNILVDLDAQIGIEQYISLAYIQIFDALAKEFSEQYGRINPDRQENWDVYQKTLTSFIDSNLHLISGEDY